jgi:hypothetical protein
MSLQSPVNAVQRSHDPVLASTGLRMRLAGGVVGGLFAGAVVFFMPLMLDVSFALKIPIAWGMGDFAFVLCAVGIVPGVLFSRRIVFP